LLAVPNVSPARRGTCETRPRRRASIARLDFLNPRKGLVAVFRDRRPHFRPYFGIAFSVISLRALHRYCASF